MDFKQITEAIQMKTGYGVAAVAGTTPVWISTLTDVMQLIFLSIGVLVGWTTYKLNRRKEEHYKKMEKENE
jgi:glycopeptide antibiotics resistance protein